MYGQETVELIDEPVKALVSFDNGKLHLHRFLWQERIYKVKSHNLIHTSRDGNGKKYHFAVSGIDNDYQLSFDPQTLEWRLEKVCFS